jgi:hypothetical protein
MTDGATQLEAIANGREAFSATGRAKVDMRQKVTAPRGLPDPQLAQLRRFDLLQNK